MVTTKSRQCASARRIQGRFRRLAVILALAAGLGTAGATAEPARASSSFEMEALDLVRSVVAEGTQAISDARRSGAAAIDFAEIYERSFATRQIGQRLLGIYWSSADTAERTQFVSAFGRYLADQLIAKFPSGNFEFFDDVLLAADDTAGAALVVRSVFVTDTSSNAIQWHISEIDGGPRIFDIVLNGRSLMADKHSEYSAFLGRNNGSVTALIASLQD